MPTMPAAKTPIPRPRRRLRRRRDWARAWVGVCCIIGLRWRRWPARQASAAQDAGGADEEEQDHQGEQHTKHRPVLLPATAFKIGPLLGGHGHRAHPSTSLSATSATNSSARYSME